MYCIKCGQKLNEHIVENHSGYICNNIECEVYNQPWFIEEHKDSQEWAVRHIRALETENATLRSEVAGCIQTIADLATKVEILISNLEKALNVDVDVNVDGTIQQ